MDPRLQHIAENLDNITIGPDEPFQFHCTQCGKCCTNREDILLNPQDLFRIAKHLEQTPQDVVEHFCEVYAGSDSRMPIVRLLPEGPTKRCPFLVRNKCRIHEAKPAVCAMFPLGRAHGFDLKTGKPLPEILYILDKPACGDDSETHTVREWLGSFHIPVDDPFYLEWSEALISFTQAFRKLEEINPAATAVLIRPAVYEHLYLAYNTSQDFLSQFQENLEKTKEFFQILLHALED